MPATIKFSKNQIKKLSEALGNSEKKVKRELRVAVNNTLKWTGTQVARVVTQELAIKVSDAKKDLIPKRAKGNETTSSLTFKKEKRLSLRHFKARQIKKGVTYKISKTKGRKQIPGGFQGPKPGVIKISWRGNVFKREGKARLPIVKRMGPSPWGVYVKSRKDKSIRRGTKKQLRKEVERRIKFIQLKQSGEIK